jgi:hypothetical protein
MQKGFGSEEWVLDVAMGLRKFETVEAQLKSIYQERGNF